MQNLIDALADYTMAQREADRGFSDGNGVYALWVEVGRLARPQGLTAGQALRAYSRR